MVPAVELIIANIFTKQQSNATKVQREQLQNEIGTPLKGLKDNVLLKMVGFFSLVLPDLPLPAQYIVEKLEFLGPQGRV